MHSRVRQGGGAASRGTAWWPWVLPAIWVAAVVAATVWTPYRAGPPIRDDGIGYHVWSYALWSGDWSFAGSERVPDEACALRPSAAFADRQVNRYPMGVGLVRLPAVVFLIGDGSLRTFTAAEHTVVLACGAAALLLTVGLMWRTLRAAGVGWWPAELAVTCGLFGTGLFHYGTHDGSYSHVFSAAGVAWLVWLWCRLWRGGRSPSAAVSLLVAAVLLLIRNTNVFLLAAAGLAVLCTSAPWRARIKHAAVLAIGGVAGASVQVAYNHYATGVWTLSSYEAGFLWHRPMAHAVLWSAERGLFTYYPALAVMVLAGLVERRTRRWTLGYIALMAALATLYGFWAQWPLGGGFGHRGFVELVPGGVVLFGLAWREASARRRVAYGVLGGVSTLMTLQLMAGYWRGSFPYAGATWRQIGRHVGPVSGGSWWVYGGVLAAAVLLAVGWYAAAADRRGPAAA